MIDQDIIQTASNNLKQAFENRTEHTKDFSTVQNIFSQNVLNKVHDYILNDSDKVWALETTSSGEEMHIPRNKIIWHSDTIIEELHMAMESITPQVQEVLDNPVNFVGIILWQDYENYKIDWHTDNPILMATMQIYLAGSKKNPGTEFELNEGEYHNCEFVPNTGYFLNQTERRLRHHTTGSVPPNVSRYSLFGMWQN